MAAIPGFLATSGYGGTVNWRLSQTFDRFDEHEIIGWPPSASIGGLGNVNAVQTHWPVGTTPRALGGIKCHSYLQDFYIRSQTEHHGFARG